MITHKKGKLYILHYLALQFRDLNVCSGIHLGKREKEYDLALHKNL